MFIYIYIRDCNEDIFLLFIRYVDRLVDSLKSKLEAAEKMAESQKVVKMKYEEALEEQRKLEPKINLIVEKTKILLSQVKNKMLLNICYIQRLRNILE